jgi:TPR repeat protein
MKESKHGFFVNKTAAKKTSIFLLWHRRWHIGAKRSKGFFGAFFAKKELLAVLLFASPAFAFDPTTLQTQAQNGDTQAAFQLGTLDYVGLGVVQDYIGAVHWLTVAANAGNTEAQCELGFLYQTGSIGQGPPPPDPVDAAPWYKKAAAAGSPCGEFGLAGLYATGQGVTKDTTQATALYAKAAAQGLALDPARFPLQQLQQRFYSVALQLTGQTEWVDLVSKDAGGGN